jgi:hypothetical protein
MLSNTNTTFAKRIKDAVVGAYPNSKVILFGSRARGTEQPDSDWDFIILLNKEKITYDDESKLTDIIYPIGLETGEIISKFLYPKNDWENKYSITPFYKNVTAEGIVL